MFHKQEKTGNTGLTGKDAVNDKNFEIFNEQESLNEAANERLEIQDEFLNSKEYSQLAIMIPNHIEVWEESSALTVNVELLKRIVSNVVNLTRSSWGLEWSFEKHSKNFFEWHEYKDVSEDSQDNLILKLAIIEACYDPSIIALNKNDSEALAWEIFDRLSLTISYDNASENLETNEQQISFFEDPAYPVLTRLLDEWIISAADFQLLDEIYAREGSFHDIKEIDNFQTINAYLTRAISNESDIVEKNTKNFREDFRDYHLEISADTPDEQKFLTQANIYAAKHYVGIKKSDGSVDKLADFQTAIKVASKDLLVWDFTINRQSEYFKKAIININSTNIDTQQLWLATLIYLKWISVGTFAQKDTVWRTRIEELLVKNHEEGRHKQLAKEADLAAIRAAELADRQAEQAVLSHNLEASNDDHFHSSNPRANGNPAIEQENTNQEEKKVA